MIDDNDTKSPEEADMNKRGAKVPDRKGAKIIFDGQDNQLKNTNQADRNVESFLPMIHNIQYK